MAKRKTGAAVVKVREEIGRRAARAIQTQIRRFERRETKAGGVTLAAEADGFRVVLVNELSPGVALGIGDRIGVFVVDVETGEQIAPAVGRCVVKGLDMARLFGSLLLDVIVDEAASTDPWELVDDSDPLASTSRLRVPGGWLYRMETMRPAGMAADAHEPQIACTFVPKPRA